MPALESLHRDLETIYRLHPNPGHIEYKPTFWEATFMALRYGRFRSPLNISIKGSVESDHYEAFMNWTTRVPSTWLEEKVHEIAYWEAEGLNFLSRNRFERLVYIVATSEVFAKEKSVPFYELPFAKSLISRLATESRRSFLKNQF